MNSIVDMYKCDCCGSHFLVPVDDVDADCRLCAQSPRHTHHPDTTTFVRSIPHLPRPAPPGLVDVRIRRPPRLPPPNPRLTRPTRTPMTRRQRWAILAVFTIFALLLSYAMIRPCYDEHRERGYSKWTSLLSCSG